MREKITKLKTMVVSFRKSFNEEENEKTWSRVTNKKSTRENALGFP